MNKYYSLFTKLLGTSFIVASALTVKAQYCTTGLYSYGCGLFGDEIESVSTTGGSTNISNLNNGCSGGYAGYGYITNHGTLTIQAGQSFSITVVNNPSYNEYYTIYVDFNGDGDFADPGEAVYTATSSTNYGATVNGGPITVPVPTTATAGNTRLRVRCVFGQAASSACSYHGGGEVEDYPMVITPACNGPVFTAHPTDQNFCLNGTAGFTATATSAATYNWQVNTGTGWTDISNNAIYSGATTNSLSLTHIPAAYNNYEYRLKSVSSCGTPSYSNSASLTFYAPIVVSKQTTGLIACEDAYTSVYVNTSGPATSYQWQIGTLTNGYVDLPAQFPYMGVNSDTLQILSAADTLNGLNLRCIISGPCDPTISAAIPIDIIIGPYINRDPIDDTVLPYVNAHFEVAGAGNPLFSLYWQASTDNGATFVNINDNSFYSGSKAVRLTIINPTPALTGMKFRCILKSKDPNCGLLRDTSAVATLYVGNYNSVSDVNKGSFDITPYPNPVNGSELFVNAADLPVNKVYIKVFDKLGRSVYEGAQTVSSSKILKVPVQNIAAGVYSMQVMGADRNLLGTSSFTKQ